MSGHVSMMNDVLIAQMPATLLRSTMRAIISREPASRSILLQHVRQRLQEDTPPFIPSSDLFPDSGDTEELEKYLSLTRCLFSCHMISESLPYLTHLLNSIPLPTSTAPTTTLAPFLPCLLTSSQDIIQAIQAVKESPSRGPNLENLLLDLLHGLGRVSNKGMESELGGIYERAFAQVKDALGLLYPDAHLNGYSSTSNGYESKEQTSLIPFPTDTTPSDRNVQYISLGPKLTVPRIFNGLWQMSSPAWGSVGLSDMDKALVELVKGGLVATDMADHYGDAELIYGSFRNRLPPQISSTVIAATKWCVFAPLKEPVSEEMVLKAVEERSRRLGGRAELLQFHWQDYSNSDYLPILKHLLRLTTTHPHLVTAIGLCNFDSTRTTLACEYLIRETGSVGIVSNQVQYSLIDSRPLFGMAEVCEKYGLKLLTYGSFCGGYLSDRWLDKPAPDAYNEKNPLTPSQRKYYDMISTWGSWKEFTLLLHTLSRIASKHSVDISNIATKWVLQRPEVGAIIVGTRLGISSNAEANLRLFDFELDEGDVRAIEEVALGVGRERAKGLFDKIGDCGQEYR